MLLRGISFIVDPENEVKAGIFYPALFHCMPIKSDVVGVTKMSPAYFIVWNEAGEERGAMM